MSESKSPEALPLSRVPDEGCRTTREELREEGHRLADACPACAIYGTRCLVAAHPNAASPDAGGISRVGILSAPKSTSLYAQHVLSQFGTAIITELGACEGANITGDISFRKFTDEYEFNAFMYPYLASMLSEGQTLVNSEHHKYLEVEGGSRKNDLKPDFWVSSIPALISEKDAPAKYAVHGCTYGCPLDNCTFTVDCIMEGKVSKINGTRSISMTDIGKLFLYLDSLSASRNATPRGVLYNSYEYVFAEFRESCLHSIHRCLWSTPGSLTSLSRSLRLSELNGTVCALRHFLASSDTSQINSVLGRGRFGCVFEVTRNGERSALKVVAADAENPHCVAEFNRMVDMHEAHPELFAAVVRDSLVTLPEFIYYFINDVGFGGNHKIGARAAALKLAELHSHGFTHGDPRIQNIIELQGGVLKWIDLLRATSAGSIYEDIKVYFESIFGFGILGRNDASALVQDYVYAVQEKESLECLQFYIQKVYEACRK